MYAVARQHVKKGRKMKDPLHSLSARVNPTLEQMRKEIQDYRAFVRGHMMAIGLSWESVVPYVKASCPYRRFRWASDRFDRLLDSVPDSETRHLALQVLHERMHSICTEIEHE